MKTFFIAVSVILKTYTLFGSHFSHLRKERDSFLQVWYSTSLWNSVNSRAPKQSLGGETCAILGSGRSMLSCHKRWCNEICRVQQLLCWMHGCSRCSLHLRSQELTTFPDSSKQMLFSQPPSVICSLTLVKGKTSIRSTRSSVPLGIMWLSL